MKSPITCRKDGFTLVELLVVIAIIAVLAGAGFAAGNAAIQKAKKTTSLASCTALEMAVSNFYTEYGSMPVTGAAGGGADDAPAINTRSDLENLKILLGLPETSTPPLNGRSIKFLSVKEGKGNKNGLMYNTTGTTITGLFDPWGGPYFVVMDTNYDDKVEAQPAGATASKILNGRKAAAWSNGADGAGTATGKPGDDVITW